MVTLIFPTQGNVVALKRTLDSVKNIVDEIIVGDVCVFGEDKDTIDSFYPEYNIRRIELPFNFIFHSGFANTLNFIAAHAKNEYVLYLNVGEVIEKFSAPILETINNNPEANCFYLDHSVEKHRWYRLYKKDELMWNGYIHEELIGEQKPFHKPIFTFADTEKDTHPFKAKVYNDLKEMCYFNQYIRLVEHPELKGITHEWWLKFAKENYGSMKERLLAKGERYEAMKRGELTMFHWDINFNKEFEKERFESSTLVEFQGSKKSL